MRGLKTEEEDLEIHRLVENLRELEPKVKAEEEAQKKLQDKYEEDEDSLEKAKSELRQSSNEKEKLEKEKENVEKALKDVKGKVEGLEQEVFGEFCRRRGVASVKEFRGENIVEYERSHRGEGEAREEGENAEEGQGRDFQLRSLRPLLKRWWRASKRRRRVSLLRGTGWS